MALKDNNINSKLILFEQKLMKSTQKEQLNQLIKFSTPKIDDWMSKYEKEIEEYLSEIY
ncbi:hypothetical protein [Fundicoccus culcitae]|uniref:Uncharacterized protein n=1 Tax=Fundicoccus culcitae TaxID=2969821 RepID=A0ABY5P4J3_9LACT|nr:hypothetical protein [Fundicoccus culcitae]UUX33612.1 hypothetical protein NRE15_12000 [Fundicoccus culcitae]